MRCLRRGERRAEFVQALHRRLEADENVLTALLDKSTADDFFEQINTVLIEVGQEVFGNPESIQQKAYRLEREQLLEQRRQLRLMLPEVAEEHVVQVQHRLRDVSRLHRLFRRRALEEWREALLEEVREHWKHRRLAEATRLARRAAGSRFGPKKRDYATIRGTVDDVADLKR
eukprot:2944658-Pyramimonas_sp.AAC.1